MAWTWTKSWSSADDGSTFGGADIQNIQTDISNQAVDLTSAQTISGNKTLSGTTIISGAITLSGTITASGDITFSGAVNLPATGVIIGTANQGDIFYDDGTDLARLTPGTSGQYLKTQGASANPIWVTIAFLTNAAQYYEPDTACVLALAGYCADPASAGIFKDSSAYGNDFTITSAPPEAAGKVSQRCMDLDGSADFLERASEATFGDCNEITVEAWFNTDIVTAGGKYIFDNPQIRFGMAGGTELICSLDVGTGEATVTSSGAGLEISTWYYLVMTYSTSDNTLRFYLNASSVGTDDTKSGDIDAISDVTRVGRDYSNGGAFNGRIDGLRVLTRQMGSTEITARYNAFK